MRVEQDFIMTFTKKEWSSFPKVLLDTLFYNYKEFVHRFTSFTEFERTDSIQIQQSIFFCALEQSDMWDFFDKWLEERDYELSYDYWIDPWLGHWIREKEDE